MSMWLGFLGFILMCVGTFGLFNLMLQHGIKLTFADLRRNLQIRQPLVKHSCFLILGSVLVVITLC